MDQKSMLLKIKQKMDTLTQEATRIVSELEKIKSAEKAYANQLTKIQHYLSCYDALIKEIEDEDVNDGESTVQEGVREDSVDVDAPQG